jgi:hypothetical protein
MTNEQRTLFSGPRLAVALGACLLVSPMVSRGGAASVEVQPHPQKHRVDVLVGGEPFTAYIWPERLAKPVLFPIRTARGTLVTRGFPLEPRPGERVDHPHQVGLWFNYGNVNGVDFWNNSEALSAEEAAKMGTIRHRAITRAEGGTDRGTLEVEADWILPDGSTAVKETTTFVFHGTADSRTIDRITRLIAPPGGEGVLFADNKEGLLGLRVTRALEMPSDEPEVFTDASGKPTTVPVLDNEGVNGLYTSSEGLEGGAVWGTRARWVALSGRVQDEDVILLVLDHPANPGYPTYWHARGYGLFAANPLGEKVFSEGREELNFRLDPGEKMVFRYRLVVGAGPFSAESAEQAWKTFAAEHPESKD